VFALALYTGLRPNEYNTAKIEGNFIVAVNSKRKNKRKAEVLYFQGFQRFATQ
jgi:hypothetical protein